jgi:hypothetical protein
LILVWFRLENTKCDLVWFSTKPNPVCFSTLWFSIEAPLACILGSPTLHDMHQITPSKKYVNLIYKKLGFPNFQSFPALFSVFATCAKNTKDFQNL